MSLLPLCLEDDQKQIEQIEAWLKEALTDDEFAVYKKVTMIRWAGECVDVYIKKIRQLVGLAGFKGDGLEKLTKLTFVTGVKHKELRLSHSAYGDPSSYTRT